jgi:hypothetical protein
VPSDLRLCGEGRKRLVGSEEKFVANLTILLRGEMVGLFVEVRVVSQLEIVAGIPRLRDPRVARKGVSMSN